MSTSARPARPDLQADTVAEPEVRSQAPLGNAVPEITASEQSLRDILDSIRQTIVLLSPDASEPPRLCSQRFRSDRPGTFSHFQAHTYLGSDSKDQIALANKIAGGQPTKFATWARVNFPVPSDQLVDRLA